MGKEAGEKETIRSDSGKQAKREKKRKKLKEKRLWKRGAGEWSKWELGDKMKQKYEGTILHSFEKKRNECGKLKDNQAVL